jgi:Carbohydrate esterase, sialic acid-specific acetylesterase
MKNRPGTRRSSTRNPFRRWPAAWLALGATLACGVVEHPHATDGVDTSNDFGPSPSAGSSAVLPPVGGAAGSTAVTAGTAPIVTGGTGVVGVGGVGGAPGGGAQAVGGASGGAVSAAGSGTGGTPLSGVTINLGGTEVPMERAIGFIHIGHSNMAGRATVPTSSRPYHFQQTDPHAWMYHPGSMPQLAIEPKTAGDTPDSAGPGTSLVKQAAALAPSTYFISLGWAKESAYCSQFVPGGLYYDQLIAGPKAIKGKITFGAIFIYLGITERHGSDADRNGFAQCINKLVTAIRTDVGVPDLPAIMNDYEVEATGELEVGSEEYNAIYPQIKQCPTVVSNFALVPCDGLGMQDDHHFNLDGQFTWVQRAMMTLQTKGWFKWH